MSDAFPLPPRPHLEQYKKRAKELVRLCKSGDRDALRAWVADWIETLLKLEGRQAYTPAELSYLSDHTVRRIAKHLKATDPASLATCTLAQAQFAIAREHGFASWPKFARHLEELTRPQSPISDF